MKSEIAKLSNLSICLLALALAGCDTMRGTQLVNVPVPIPCQEKEPERPHMPTASLKKGADVEQWVRAARAELKVRQAHEQQLRAALRACIAPVS